MKTVWSLKSLIDEPCVSETDTIWNGICLGPLELGIIGKIHGVKWAGNTVACVNFSQNFSIFFGREIPDGRGIRSVLVLS